MTRRAGLAPGFVVSLVLGSPLFAGVAMAWEEPQRGTATRKAMMDALRPHAEWQLGAPVEFVIHDLRRAGDLGFAMVHAQRPGGRAINVPATPGFARGDVDMEGGDPTELQALYRKVGETWVAVHWAMAATDVWFAWGPLCREYRPVIADFCEGVFD